VFALIVVAVIGVVAAIAYFSYQAAKKRREALFMFAAKHGLSYSQKDPGRLERTYDFHLFSLGDGRGCENVLSGVWEGLPVQEADYWYYTESTDSEGRTSRSYSRFSVIVVQMAAWLPDVRVERENVFTRMADHMGMTDLEFESEDFNRCFNVKAKDREFAFKLIDARMMQWLLDGKGAGVPDKLCLEVNGGHVLLYCNRLPAERVAELFHAGKAFVDHVPKLVWNEYGKAAS
jgi:hypothetical protein